MTETVRRTIISFSQLDQYIRCPLKYRFMYVDRVDPEWIPAALIFGRGIDNAAAHYFRGAAAGTPPSLADVQDVFASSWDLETSLREVKFWKGSKAELLDQGTRMLAVFHAGQDPATEIVDVQRRLTVPLIDQQTGEVLDRELVVVMDLLERDGEGHLVVVDLKTAGRKYTELQVETSLQLTVYSYAAEMGGLADREDVRLRFDVLTKTKVPELHRYPTSRDRQANVRLFRLASEVLRGVEAGVFHPIVGWQCKECQFRTNCWAWQ
jgi:putative RecB family exonuclease